MKILQASFLALCTLLLAGCMTQVPEGIEPVAPFDLSRYEGRWYEIARLDHGFERGLTDVNARYRIQPDGSVEVVNRGYDPARGAWRQATGRAVFIDRPGVGSLKVSFFGPFYGGYHVVELDPEYRWSLVSGPTRGYLWILARDKALPDGVRDRLVAKARALGFDTDSLVFVEHSRVDPDR